MSKSTVITSRCDRCHQYCGHRVESKRGLVWLHCFVCKFDAAYDPVTGRRHIKTVAR